MSLAPIVLFVYNRPAHTEKTLHALNNNFLADQSTLYVFCDGVKENASQVDIKKIAQTRKIVTSKNWCKDVKIIESDSNKGLANSIIHGLRVVLEKYGRAIILEDDILTSPYFLTFMNNALNLYKDQEQIKSVAGYMEPIKTTRTEGVLLPFGSSWGWATWKRTFDEIDFDSHALMNKVSKFNKDELERFNYAGENYYEMLRSQSVGKIDSWAIRFYTSCFFNNGLHLKPTKSLTQNIGFDINGTHCSEEHPIHSKTIIYNEQISIPPQLDTLDQLVNNKIYSLYDRYRFFYRLKRKKHETIDLIKRILNLT